MTSTTSINKIAIEQEQQLHTEPSYTDLKFANNGEGIPNEL
jgi:hypothetical protein